MNIPNQAIEQEDETKPLWRYVSKLRKTTGGGNNMIQCSLCNFILNGSYTRVRAHLLKLTGAGVRSCPYVTASKLVELKKLDNEAKLKIEGLKQKKVSLPPVSDEGNQTRSDVNPKFKGFLQAAFNIQMRDTLDCEIARMFYSSGLPFHLAISPYYRSAFSNATNTSNLSGYVPPTYNKLRGPLLSKERSHVENLLQPIRNSWNQKGVTIVSDGWSDPQRRPLINFMAITEWGSMFLKSVDGSGEIKDKEFIAKHMRDVIMEVGHNNVVQIITDNAVVCKAADTDMASLHLVYGMWDSMIENVKIVIYQHERKTKVEYSSFFNVVEYYNREWLDEDSKRLAPHQDHEITQERKKCFMRYFDDANIRTQVNIEFANFSGRREDFDDADSLRDRSKMDAKSWWIVLGTHAPTLQKIALKLLGQPCSSSCCERNWSTYSFIHSLKRNKMTPKRA
ncbi:uncharacterized protein [Phaseolus vulgaris]|uniref:uncharacterized protein n=1 Tax=Phaseolus vulgaris TaxID=3885 RepID=UPI0035CC2033